MHIAQHTVARLRIELPGSFDSVVEAFEEAVPALDVPELGALIRAGEWPAIETWTRGQAPHGFLLFWRNDVRPLMRVAGDHDPAVAYLMGNHVTAESMFRHDPRVMNYAPLRVELSQASDEPVVFTVDRPSDHFGAFGDPRILEVGRQLDHELAELLALLGASPADLDVLTLPDPPVSTGTIATH
ncbi:hypothetical protein N1031_06030 [Herbiconiux moechotypicola]|uniref:DUF302 domain-containing protein n=1 Tax=Herbiconiux moechotypicola TaxID=637393 RepID=A0ABN3DEG7_9MICO|nr:hypothetical protein [Herbiconiux moechotypicola]MCS5729314.1 hypothetical protein [Herbiconiux moechotypicola]